MGSLHISKRGMNHNTPNVPPATRFNDKAPLSPLLNNSIGLGFARRPSDNLLSKFSNIDEDSLNLKKETGKKKKSSFHINELSPPNKNFVVKHERPISDESIATKASELFSSPSSDMRSTASSIEHELDDLNEVDDSITSNKNINNSIRLNSDEKNNNAGSRDTSKLFINQNISKFDSQSTLTYMSNNNNNNKTNKESYSKLQNQNSSHTTNISETSSTSTANFNTTYNSNRSNSIQKNHLDQNNKSNNANNLTSSNNNNLNNDRSYLHSNKSMPLLRTNSIQNTRQSNSIHSKLNPQNQNNPQFFSHSNSTTAILHNKLPLTASQRYRLRKEQNETSLRKSIKKKEKYYEENDNVLELQDGYVDDTLTWNIPMASIPTTSFLTAKNNSKIHHLKKRNNSTPTFTSKMMPPSLTALDFFDMPASPIPGIQNTTDFQYFHDTTQNLTNVYLHSSERLSKSILDERTTSADFLPLNLKRASDNGMEDLVLVSQDKLELMSNSRPSWLPPKDPAEKRAHEDQISKSLSMASIDQLDRSKDRDQRLIRDETNKQKLIILMDRDVTRNSSLTSLKKIVWETQLPKEFRLKLYNELLQSKVELITKKYIESFDQLLEVVENMEFPKNKEVEIEKLITNSLRNKRNSQFKISENLKLMLQVKSVSVQGILPGDELLFHHFLIDNETESLSQIWNIVNLLQMTCFNDSCREKYDEKIIYPKGVISQHLLRDDSFKDEYNGTCLNFITWWNILERMDHDLFMWMIDIIVVNNSQCFKTHPVKEEQFVDKNWEYYRSKKVVTNYKILLSFTLNILLNYHFGYDNLKKLSDLKDPKFCIPIAMDNLFDIEEVNCIFVRKWLHYYKKF